MKKAFALGGLMLTPMMAFAQGTVVFNNNASGWAMQQTSMFDSTLIRVPAGGGQVELLTAPANTPFTPIGFYNTVGGFHPYYYTMAGFLAANPGWSAIATTGIAPVAGVFNGGIVTLPGIAGGANAEYVVIGWTGSSATWDGAAWRVMDGVFVGSSPMLTTTTGDPTTTPPAPPTRLSDTFTGITLLVPTPEPTSVMLAGVGALLSMVWRRRARRLACARAAGMPSRHLTSNSIRYISGPDPAPAGAARIESLARTQERVCRHWC